MEKSKKPLKVFISQPMNGKSDDEIQFTRSIIMYKLNHLRFSIRDVQNKNMADTLANWNGKFELIDTIFDDFETNTPPLFYLGESIKALGSADIVIFAPDWQYARGCRIEHACCELYNLAKIELSAIDCSIKISLSTMYGVMNGDECVV